MLVTAVSVCVVGSVSMLVWKNMYVKDVKQNKGYVVRVGNCVLLVFLLMLCWLLKILLSQVVKISRLSGAFTVVVGSKARRRHCE
jgi:membrane protein CcdC involved in cytochrome C biogenesis